MTRICENACERMQEMQDKLDDALMLLSYVKMMVNSIDVGNTPDAVVNHLQKTFSTT